MSYSLTAACIQCWACQGVCPNGAIVETQGQLHIDSNECTECHGLYEFAQCASICPVETAIQDAAGHPVNPPGSLNPV